jgi:hypothetical protein
MENPNGYTIPLALEDFVPVVLGAIGCYYLVRSASARVPATWKPGIIGVLLVAAGGGSKALWKLIVAAEGTDVRLLEQALFPLLAGGFGLIAWALICGLRQRLLPWWPLAVILAAGWVAADAVRALFPAFLLTVVFSLTISAVAITWSIRLREWPAVFGFVLQLVAVFGLVPLQGQEVQTLGLQWAEQSINTIGQLGFLFGTWRLWIKVRAVPSVEPIESTTPAP